MRCEVRSYSSAKASSWPRDESAISSARWSASVSRPLEASARGPDREDFPSEAGGTDEAFTRSTLSRSLALAQEPGGNTLLILEIVVIGCLPHGRMGRQSLPSRGGFVAAFAPDWSRAMSVL